MTSVQLLCRLKGQVLVVVAYLAFLSVGYSAGSVQVRATVLPSYTFLAAQVLTGLFMLWCHFKCTLANPGFVPITANSLSAPLDAGLSFNPVCVSCKVVKPPQAHHCQVCNRCVYRRDHHCPWVNNCIGQYSQKPFVLFLLYGSLYHCLSLYTLLTDLSSQPDLSLSSALVTATALSALAMLLWPLAHQLYNIYFNLSGVDRLQRQFTRRVLLFRGPSRRM